MAGKGLSSWAGVDRRSLLALAAAAGFAPTAWAAEAAGPLHVPLKIRWNRPWMNVTLDGNGPYPYVLDCGTSQWLIDRRLAEALKLQGLHRERVGGVVGEANVNTFLVKEVLIGDGLRVPNEEFTAVALADFFRGTVPIGLLTLYPSELSFSDSELRLWRGGGFDLGDDTVALHVTRGNRRDEFVVDAEVDGHVLTFGLDTGDPGLLSLNRDTVRRLNLWDAYPKFTEYRAGSVTGDAFAVRDVRAKQIKFGASAFDNPVISLTDPNAPPNSESESSLSNPGDQAGLIGMDVLRRFDLKIDVRQGKIGLKANRDFSTVWRTDRSGLTALSRRNQKGEHIARVTGVAPGSAADTAGLKAEDRIVLADGEYPFRDFEWDLKGPPGTRLMLTIERGGARQQIPLILADRI